MFASGAQSRGLEKHEINKDRVVKIDLQIMLQPPDMIRRFSGVGMGTNRNPMTISWFDSSRFPTLNGRANRIKFTNARRL